VDRVHNGPQQFGEFRGQLLELIIVRVALQVIVDIPDEMDQALLLRAGQRVVAAVEVGYQDPPKVLQHILEKGGLAVGSVYVQDVLQVRQDPDIPLVLPQVDVRLIGVDQPTLQNPVEDTPASCTVTPGHQALQHVNNLEADSQAEAILEHGSELLQADAMDDELVHRPALQAIEMLVKPLVPAWPEPLVALLAPIACGGTSDNLQTDGSPSELEVVYEFRVDIVGEPGNLLPFAVRAGATFDLDLPVYVQFGFLRPVAVPRISSSDGLAGAEEYFLPLV